MGVLSRLLLVGERRGTLRNPSAEDLLALVRNQTTTGVSVTPESALAYSAVLACIRVLSESVATLPFILYERLERGKRRATEHWLYPLLHDAPNPAMTRFEWMSTVVGHLAGWGNAFAEIQVNGAGQPIALWPLPPNRVTVGGSAVEGLTYIYNDKAGKPWPIAAERMLHLRGLGSDGVIGYSVLSLARESVGLGLATQEFGARWFGNGARPSVVLEHPGVLGDEAYERLRNNWLEKHQGLENSHRVAILEEGMKVETIGIPPEDSQFLETRKFQRTEIAAIFRVPPHMIGDLERATFSNIEQQSIDFVTYTLGPWLACVEQRIAMSLLSPAERQRLFAEFLAAGLLRGDIQTRYAAYAVGRNWGWLSANDVRELENLNPVDGGDMYLVPLNMVPAEDVGRSAGSDMPDGSDGSDETDDEDEQPTRQIAPPARLWDHGREMRAVGRRRRLSSVGEGQIADAAQRLVNREANDIMNAARRFARREDGLEDFRRWLNEFLDNHQPVVQERLWAPTWALAQLAADEAQDEAQEAGFEGELAEENLRRFADEYMGSRAQGWVAMLRSALYDALDRAQSVDRDGLLQPSLTIRAGEPDPAWLTETEAVIDDRRANEADGWGRDEANRVVNAVAVTVWATMSVMFLRWAATGGENCPYCEKMDGRTVGIAQWFLQAGENLDIDGLPSLRPGRDMRHPPLHRGCDCNILIG